MHIFHPVFSCGRDNNIVDNAGVGGILATVDSKTGKIITNGFDEDNNEYITHPNSSIKFMDFQLPAWHDAIKLASEAALSFTDNRYLAWDFTYTDNGCLIIEVNADGLLLDQYSRKIGLLEEMNKLIVKMQ